MLLLAAALVYIPTGVLGYPEIGVAGFFICLGGLLAMSLRYGPRRAVAVSALVDLLGWYPLQSIYALLEDEADPSSQWRLPLYLCGAVLVLLLLRPAPFPDWLLPARGQWGRILAAVMACAALLGVYFGELLHAAVRDQPFRSIFLGAVVLLPVPVWYVSQLGQLLIRGRQLASQV